MGDNNRVVHAIVRGGNLKILNELRCDYRDVLAYRDKQKGFSIESDIAGPSCSNPSVDGEKPNKIEKQGSTKTGLRSQYFCFGSISVNIKVVWSITKEIVEAPGAHGVRCAYCLLHLWNSISLAVTMEIGWWWLSASPKWLLLCTIQGRHNMQDLREIIICCLCQLRGQSTGELVAEQEDEILTEFFYVGEEKEATREEMFHGKCLKDLIIGASGANLRAAKKEFNKTEDDLKSLHNVGQIIWEVLKPFDNERLIKTSIGFCYVVGCHIKVDKEKLTSRIRVVLDMTTLTIMRALLREVDPIVYNMLHEDPGNVSYSAVGGLSDQI